MFIERPASDRSLKQRKPIYGVGINDSKYIVRYKYKGKRIVCPYYKKWVAMLSRCLSAKVQETNPTYTGCSICYEWLIFSNFKEWMMGHHWKDCDLDKDLVTPGNKVYAPVFCVFVPHSLNSILNDRGAKRGVWPIGVSFNKANKNFRSRCNISGGVVDLGTYDTPEEASATYNKFKANHIREIAKDYINDIRLYNGLMKHANLIDN